MIDQQDFKNYLVVVKHSKPNSIRLILSRLKTIDTFLGERKLPYDQKTLEFLIATLKQKLKNNSVNSYIFSLNTLIDYYAYRNLPTHLIKLQPFKKNKPIIHVLTTDEIQKLWNTSREYGQFQGKNCDRMNEVYQTFIQFLALTGARFTEASLLKVQDCNFSKLEVFFLEENTKGGEWRKAYLTPPLSQLMQKLIEVDKKGLSDYVFTNMTGHTLRPQEFSVELKERAKLINLKKRIHPHLFRHSFATHLAEKGVELTKIATLLGHKDIQTTYDNYMHLADETLKKATHNHDLIGEHVPIQEKLEAFVQHVKSFKIENDPRVSVSISQSPNTVSLLVTVCN